MEHKDVPKKKRKSMDMNLTKCIVCQEEISGKMVIIYILPSECK